MDENMSRGYVLLNNKWKYHTPRYRYQPQHTQMLKFNMSKGRRSHDKLDQEDEEEHLHVPSASPQQTSRDMGLNVGSVSIPNYQQLPPKDDCNCVYFGLLLAGVGFLLPYNSFVIAVDYFQNRYPGTTIIFDMSFIYILVAFGAVILNNILVETISLRWRINFGYLISSVTLFIVAVFEVGWESFPVEIGYKLNLIAVAIVSFGCTVQQSSFYGYTSMLPTRYTQAVMTGESAAGLIISTNRIITKLLLDDEKTNTLLFFCISIFIVICCIIVHNILQQTAFVKFYISLCTTNSVALSSLITNPRENVNSGQILGINPLGDFGLVEILEDPDIYGVINSPPDAKFGILSLSSPSSAVELRATTAATQSKKRDTLFRHSDSTEFDMPFGIDEEDLKNYEPPVLPEPSPKLLLSGRSSLITKNNYQKPQRKSTKRLVSNESQFVFANESNSIFYDETHNEAADSDIGLAFESNPDLIQRFKTTKYQRKKKKMVNFDLHAQDFWRRLQFGRLNRWYQSLRSGVFSRWSASKVIWPYMLSISTAYFVTLALFPGIESEIVSCQLKSWMPVIIMAIFNLTDFIGKIIASFFYGCTSFKLMLFSCLRVVLIPLLALCVAPRTNPFFNHEIWSMLFSSILGITNGIFGSLPMILAPLLVPDELKEITGNIMTLSYSVGLTTGSALAYVIDYLLGPPLIDLKNLCQNQLLNSSSLLTRSIFANDIQNITTV